MNPGRSTIREFNGVALDIHRSSLPDGLFQEDVGSDPEPGRWKRRRGQRHTDVEQKGNPITTILGFEMNSETFGLLMVDGTDACGFVNVQEQSWQEGGGYGDTEYGEEEYGE